MSVVLPLLLASGACDENKKSDAKPSAEAKPEAKGEAEGDAKAAAEAKAEPEVVPHKPSADWPKQALSKVEDEVDGVKFSIELPEGLRKKVKEADGSFPGYVTWNGANPFMDPTFTVQLETRPPKDLDEVTRRASNRPQPSEVVRAEELEGGGMLVSITETSKEFVQVRAWRSSASTDKVLRVTLQVRDKEAIANLDELRPWLETVALSLTPA